MLKKFLIYDKWLNDKKVGILTYDDNTSEFSIEVDKNLTPQEAPFIFEHFMEKGQYTIPKEWSLKWVQERIIPSNRQLIGVIMRNLGVPEYTEYNMLIAMGGRCTNDGCYIVPLNNDMSFEGGF